VHLVARRGEELLRARKEGAGAGGDEEMHNKQHALAGGQGKAGERLSYFERGMQMDRAM